MNRVLGGFVAAWLAAGVALAVGEEPRTVGWEELALKLSAAENPFATLAPEQLMALSDVAAVRNRKARGIVASAEEVAMERNALARLQRDGIDADKLLARRAELMQKQQAAAGAVNPALDGTMVRIPGYVLPLEYSGRKVTEFLLVPWVGACIHTPPPDANQIVYVKPDRAFDIDGLFEAVWVTGRIATRASTKAVHIVDGSSNIEVGYGLRASKVERFKP